MAISTGGNVEFAKAGENVIINGIKIIAINAFATKVASDSSKLYSQNLYNLVNIAMSKDGFDLKNDIIKEMIITENGKLTNE